MEIKQFEKEFTELKAKRDKRENELKNAKDIQSQLSMTVKDDVLKSRQISNLVEQNIDIEKKDWDSFETSWDFKRNPLV